jgi:hypothetical protein
LAEYHTPYAAGFRAGAREHFGFLVSDHGFRIAAARLPFSGSFTAFFARRGAYVAVVGLSYGTFEEADLQRVTAQAA